MSSVLSWRSVIFFKQKTAYEMRISDWSSDVCSSDLFLAGLTEPRGIHLQNLTIIADLQIASDFPLDKAAKARDEIERRARHFLDCIGNRETAQTFITSTEDIILLEQDQDHIGRNSRITGRSQPPLGSQQLFPQTVALRGV